MVLDYREKKPVSKNRPRKQPAGIFFFSIFVAVIIAYTLGLVTGWMVFRPSKRNVADNPNMATELTGKDAGTQPNAKTPAAVNNEPVKEPTLTFYETLPKGSRELIGSGLNLPKSPEAPVSAPRPPQKQAAVPKEAVSADSAQKTKETAKSQEKANETPKVKEQSSPKETAIPKETATPKEAPAKEDAGKGKFVVQVASYQVKEEAEELRAKLKASGIPAYIVESRIAGKGTFFRVRAGKHLEQKAAQELAEKTGKGAILIPE
jgi:cell division septation protein DedD